MEAQKITDKTINTVHCDWIIQKAEEIKALLSYDDTRMIELNRVRALSAIETSINSLKELEAFVKSI